MIFENNDKIVSRGQKVTDDVFFDDYLPQDLIADVLLNLFDGAYNTEEIIITINQIKSIQKVQPLYVKNLFDTVNLSDWYYQDESGSFKVKTVPIILLLQLNTSSKYDTVVISDTHRTPNTPSNKDVGGVMKKIRDTFKNFLKEFNNG